jgi:hypothetical protein
MLRTYTELHAALSALPPTEAGNIRVYRGQAGHYSTLTPTALREPGISDYGVWHLYQTFVTARARNRTDTASVNDFWFDALVQHYGPGTKFLDVTRSIDAAYY